MGRGLAHAAAWLLATGAAVTLSWWGVHTVLAGTAYDRPRALTVTADASERGGAEADGAHASSTRRPKPTSSSSAPGDEPPGPSSGSPSEPDSEPPPEKTPDKDADKDPEKPAAPDAAGQVKSYTAAGGRVVFDLGDSSADLVSATPDSGWQMQVWEQSEWIRVNFTSGNRTTSVFCTWNGHPPTVQVVEG